MSVADFFNTLTVDMIDAFVAEGQEEHLALEFKTLASADMTAGADKKNFAEALSGFANSAGGVVVWGVATKKNTARQDVAAAKQPIVNVAALLTRLREFTPLYVTPPVAGVTHRAFEVGDDAGFAATYIPPSDAGPHMALVGLDRYYKRGPVGFYPLQHFYVADMFGRRQRSVLRLELSEPILGSSGNGRKEVRIVASLVNDGRASAVAPFVRLELPPSFGVNPLGFTSRDQGASLRLITEASQPPAYAVVGRTDFIVHPKVRFQIVEITAGIRDDQRVPACDVKYSASALDAAPADDSIAIEPLRIAVALTRTVAGTSES
jgi:hypothetical protein